MSDMNQVASNLWIGGWSSARDCRDQFDVVVNVAIDAPHNGDYHFNLVDGPGNDPQEFERAVECVRSALVGGKKVLLHCVAGRSRSVTVGAAATAKATGDDFEEVLRRFKVSRGLGDVHPFGPHDALLSLARNC